MTDTVPPVPAGDAPFVVLVPGLGLDARAWSRVRSLLTSRSTVVTLPTMGQPASGAEDLTVESQAVRLAQQLPARGGLVLVGHSASCQVIAEAAARHPSVRALVLIGPSTDPTAATWPRMVTQWIRTARHERAWEVGVLAPQYYRTGLASMVRGMDRIRQHRLDLALTSVSATVVVIRGDHDRIASARWCADLAARSSGTVTTIPNAAHMVPLTHPEAVAGAIELLGFGGART